MDGLRHNTDPGFRKNEPAAHGGSWHLDSFAVAGSGLNDGTIFLQDASSAGMNTGAAPASHRITDPDCISCHPGWQQQINAYKRKHKLLSYGITALLCLVLLTGLYVVWHSFNASQAVQTSQYQVAAAVDDEPTASGGARGSDETQPNLPAYTVEPHMPRYLSVPSVGVAQARVLEVDVDENNRLEVPENIYDTGWYSSSVLPGNGSGAAVITGHSSGWTSRGVFDDLGSIEQDEIVNIELGSGEVIEYRVVEKERVDYREVDMVKALSPIVSGKESLTLITCTGEFDEDTNQYLERDIVYAVRQ